MLLPDFGVASLTQMRGDDWTYPKIRQSVKSGNLIPVKRGWYAVPGANQNVIRALKIGGRLGCLSALKEYGVWVPQTDRDLHVVLGKNAAIPKLESTVFHRYDFLPETVAFSVEDCLRQVMRHHDPETGLIVLESAVQKSLVTPFWAQMLIKELPSKKQRIYRFFDPSSQSGSETRVRLFFQRRGVKVHSQHKTSGGWVDMLVGQSWIIECDSRAFHDNKTNHNIDCHRDLSNFSAGFVTTLLSYPQIWFEWEDVKPQLLGILRKKEHLRLPRPCRTFGT